jgi:hypothetical protein
MFNESLLFKRSETENFTIGNGILTTTFSKSSVQKDLTTRSDKQKQHDVTKNMDHTNEYSSTGKRGIFSSDISGTTQSEFQPHPAYSTVDGTMPTQFEQPVENNNKLEKQTSSMTSAPHSDATTAPNLIWTGNTSPDEPSKFKLISDRLTQRSKVFTVKFDVFPSFRVTVNPNKKKLSGKPEKRPKCRYVSSNTVIITLTKVLIILCGLINFIN